MCIHLLKRRNEGILRLQLCLFSIAVLFAYYYMYSLKHLRLFNHVCCWFPRNLRPCVEIQWNFNESLRIILYYIRYHIYLEFFSALACFLSAYWIKKIWKLSLPNYIDPTRRMTHADSEHTSSAGKVMFCLLWLPEGFYFLAWLIC